jgi:hypothetical protein
MSIEQTTLTTLLAKEEIRELAMLASQLFARGPRA